MENAISARASAVPVRSMEGIAAADFNQLVQTHQRRVYRVLLSLLRDPDAAGTLTQECFLRAYERRGQFRGESPVQAWLLRIAVNLARDYHRNRRVSFWRRLVGENDSNGEGSAISNMPARESSPEQVLLAREEVAAVWRAVEQLSPRQHAIFILHFVEEMTMAEMGAVLGIESGTVKVHLFRALNSVRKKMEDQQWR